MYTATLKLEQNGKNGTIRTELDFGPKGQDFDSEAHTCLAHVAALWLQTQPRMIPDVRDDESEEVFSASLKLSQEELGEDVYTALTMNPKLKFDDKSVPSAYEAICFLSNAWLQMAGIIDEEGNVVDDDAVVDQVDLSVTRSNRVH